jgi:hypothetical protein
VRLVPPVGEAASHLLGGGPLSRTSIRIGMGALVLVGACQGQIGLGGPGAGTPTGAGAGGSGSAGSGVPAGSAGAIGTGTGGAANTGGPGSGGSPPPPLDCSQPRGSTARLRVLTESQYNNSLLDILQIAGNPANGVGPSLDDVSLEQRAELAATVATQAITNIARWAPCTPPATGSAATCEQQFIDKIGAKVYRRPLSTAERTELKTLFDAGIKEKDFNTGVEWFLTALFQSPEFVYEIIRPAPSEQRGEARPLDGYEYASRLAYFIWDGPPDDMLTSAAAINDASDPNKWSAQITRMLQDARFTRGVAQFYARWLNLNAFGELARDASGFDHNVVNALSTSLLMSATQLYSSASPNIKDLFSGDKYYLNDVLRTFYGVSGTGTAFTAVSMSGQSRRGILTHPAMMAVMARPDQSYPIGRGLFLLRNALCKLVEPPPAGVTIPPFPAVKTGVSTREALEMLTASPVCQDCHAMINGAGFAFESFDEVGRFRAMDQGKLVNTSGSLRIGKDVDGSFASGDELLAKLGDSKDVRACFAEAYLDFALGKPVTDPADGCSIQSLGTTFGASGDLKQLISSVAGSDSFRLRHAEGVGQ